MKKAVTVNISGYSLDLRTEDSPDYVRSLADYFGMRMDEIRGAAKSASAHQIALLAGVQVVDELFRLQQSAETAEHAVRTGVDSVLKLLDEDEPS